MESLMKLEQIESNYPELKGRGSEPKIAELME
jgi:hypothetical protein